MTIKHDELQEMLAHHDQAAQSIRYVLGLMGKLPGQQSFRKVVGSTRNGNSNGRPRKVLQAAVTIDRARRKYTRKTKPGKSKVKAGKVTASTAQFLSQFDQVEPFKPNASRQLGPLVMRGYLVRKGNGYIRTAKDFSVRE